MRYVRIITEGTGPAGAFGIVRADGVIELLDGDPLCGARRTGGWCHLKDVRRWLPPVNPPNIFALGMNYESHSAETKTQQPAEPVIFLKATSALIGHNEAIVLPKEAPDEVDYEAELTVVIGHRARNVPPDRAGDYIFGYTCGNDVSARDCQMRRDRQWARAKSFDTFCPLGPWTETEFDPADKRVICRLNGREMQNQSTSDMFFKVPEIIAYLSRNFTLLPGTVIMTGTPAGVGFARRPPVFLRPGDRVEVEVEGIGVLANSVAREG